MLIKKKDSLEKAIQQLKEIADQESLPSTVRTKAKQELRKLLAGQRGEKEAAYYIDFHYKNSPNWAIIHDLRIKHNGRIAQIDHLLINRFLEFYVLESKTFIYGLKITEHGEFLFWYNNRYHAMPSPIEQNKRHILVLKELLADKNILPKRLGVTLPPTFRPYILISPKARVIRPPQKQFDTSTVIKADEFFRQIQNETENADPLLILGSVAKMISHDTLRTLALRLVKHHRPVTINYYARFGITPVSPSQKDAQPQPKSKPKTKPKPQSKPQAKSEPKPEPASQSQPSQKETPSDPRPKKAPKYFCYRCHKPISKKVAIYCFQHKERFQGKAYCFDCQKHFPG